VRQALPVHDGAAGASVWRRGLRLAASRQMAGNALRICLVVGTVLNLINQGPALWSGQRPSLLHLLLNFLVPYAVATYSAVRLRLQQEDAAGQPPNGGRQAPP
jgi:hypothetical protein